MATLVLTSVGTLIGGPIGGAIGALIGQQADNAVFAPKGRKGPRLGDLAVQTSSYGTAIPKLFGTMRVAGTVIWATDLTEDKHKQGGGKGRPKTTTYSYSASFAVALSGREIEDVRRIWADGKLLRGAAGDFKTETKYRLHRGGEQQLPDGGIAAAEGLASTPAFRGIAHAVFEDFQLGDYGNRIPSLTFEVIGDAGGTAAGTIVEAVSGGAVDAEPGQALTGFAAHGDSVRGVIAVLNEAVPAPLYDDGARLRMGASGATAPLIIAAALAEATEARRGAGAHVPDSVSIGYYDVARDYQAGLQRASYGEAGGGAAGQRHEQIALPAAIDAGAAKAIATGRLDHHWRTRERRALTLPWSQIGVRPGHVVRLGDDDRLWLVSGWTFERMAVRLDLIAHAGARAASLPAVSGRAVAAGDLVHGPTSIHVFDAPSLGDGGELGPRMLIAAAGASPGWRSAVLEASSDGGANWQAAGVTAPAAVMGRAAGVLASAGSTLFDRTSSVEVALLNDDMWLESRDDDALVAGTANNLAMLGDELIQFGSAESLGGRRFRLSRLLRGRRGSEWAAAGHTTGEPFTLIEPESLIAIAAPPERIGAMFEVAARGIGDGDVPAIAAHIIGVEAVRPPGPAHLRASRGGDGAVTVGWTRRSRAGWAWIDGVDAPLGEAGEAYRVTISGGAVARTAEVESPGFVYDAGSQAADGAMPGITLTIEVVQIGALAISRPARISFAI